DRRATIARDTVHERNAGVVMRVVAVEVVADQLDGQVVDRRGGEVGVDTLRVRAVHELRPDRRARAVGGLIQQAGEYLAVRGEIHVEPLRLPLEAHFGVRDRLLRGCVARGAPAYAVVEVEEVHAVAV